MIRKKKMKKQSTMENVLRKFNAQMIDHKLFLEIIYDNQKHN